MRDTGRTVCRTLYYSTARGCQKSKRLVGLDDSFVDQQNGNIIPDRVNSSALSALETVSCVFESERLFAERAYQYVE
jgi:hypothetical protein